MFYSYFSEYTLCISKWDFAHDYYFHRKCHLIDKLYDKKISLILVFGMGIRLFPNVVDLAYSIVRGHVACKNS